MRVLVVNESSTTQSGYGIYGKEILTRLHKEFEVAELACFPNEFSTSVPWKVYPNQVREEERQQYDNTPLAHYGGYLFDRVVRNFKPHAVLDFRDPYMYTFEYTSGYRNYYKWGAITTVDGVPQKPQWNAMAHDMDACFTLTGWGRSVLEHSNICVAGVVSQAASQNFHQYTPAKKAKLRQILGLEGKYIVGTVMRNQPRKLFDDIFIAMSQIQHDDVLLYCHSAYPDIGWDFGDMLMRHGLLNKVLFTYRCESCKNVYPAFYHENRAFCKFCGNTATMPHVNNGIKETELVSIYNTFDLYLQIATREGFGMPQVEAAACGVPVAFVDYSAMSEVGRKIGGTAVALAALKYDHSMKLYDAVPNIHNLIDTINHHYNFRENHGRELYELNYNNWDNTCRPWQEWLRTIDPEELDRKWQEPPDIKFPSSFQDVKCGNLEFVQWLVHEVLHKPELDGSYFMARVASDLNRGFTYASVHPLVEAEMQSDHKPYDRRTAYNHCVQLRHYFNTCEESK